MWFMGCDFKEYDLGMWFQGIWFLIDYLLCAWKYLEKLLKSWIHMNQLNSINWLT